MSEARAIAATGGPTGLRRLRAYISVSRGRVAVLALAAALNAACHAGGWLLVGDAVDHGIRAGNERRLTIVVGDLRGRQRRWRGGSARSCSAAWRSSARGSCWAFAGTCSGT